MIKITSKQTKIFGDMVLNICASALPIVLLQLFVLPATANRLGNAQYGLMLTLVSLNSMISLALGNVLNNVRLIRQGEYEGRSDSGDFNLLLAVFSVANAVIIVITAGIYTNFKFGQTLFTLFASQLMLLKNYISVWFRLEINYKKVLIDSFLLLLGYCIGFFAFVCLGVWQLIYITGYAFSCIYILCQHNLLAEPWTKTKNFHARLSDCLTLSAATVIGSALTYVDKLLLYPLLGGAAVSIYYSASIIGKMCSMLVSPISSVMLSYLAKMKMFKRSAFFQFLAFALVMAGVAYFICLLASEPLLLWLYPEWAMDSLAIIKTTTATAMMGFVVSVLDPIVLKFCKLNRQVMISIASLFTYVAFCFKLQKLNGLAGFALGVLAATTVKLVLSIVIFLVDYRPNEI